MVKYEVSSIVITTVFLVLVVLVVTGNMVVCLIIKRSRQMRYVAGNDRTVNWIPFYTVRLRPVLVDLLLTIINYIL